MVLQEHECSTRGRVVLLEYGSSTNGGYGLKPGYAGGPYSGCTGGAWDASIGWNFGDIKQVFYKLVW